MTYNKQFLIYLASPYNHSDIEMMQWRYRMNVKAVTEIFHKGLIVFSPVVHNHPSALEKDLGRDFNYWENIDLNFLIRCDELWIYKLQGWRDSLGVRKEIEFAESNNILIKPYYNDFTIKE